MADENSAFHELGILPNNLPPPPDVIRTFAGTGRVVAVYVIIYGLLVLALGLTALIASTTPMPLNVLGVAACLSSIVAITYLVGRNDYRWIELDGNTLRARRLYTWSTIERSVEEIAGVLTIYHAGQRAETLVLNKVFGRVKGAEIRFRDGRTPLRIYRTDPAMINAQEFIEGVLYRLQQITPLEVDMANVDGRPLVRSVYPVGEQPSEPWKNTEALNSIVLFAIVFAGVIFSYWYVQEQDKSDVVSRPPQEITLAALLQNGPGQNRHVTLTEYEPGGYTYEEKDGRWTEAWVALFPKGAPRREIQAVVSSRTVHSDDELDQLLRPGKLTGICSAKPSTGWGMTLGPNLVSANGDLPLNAAWNIEQTRRRPLPELAMAIKFATIGIYVLAVVVSLWFIGRGILTGR